MRAVLTVVVVTVAADAVAIVTSVEGVAEVGPANDPDTDPVVVASLEQPAAMTTSTPMIRSNGSGRQGFTLTSFTPRVWHPDRGWLPTRR